MVPLEVGVRPALRPVSQASYQEQTASEAVAVLLVVRVEQEPLLVASRFCLNADVLGATFLSSRSFLAP